jgi:hypothetical protein
MRDVEARVFGRIVLKIIQGNGLWICGSLDLKTGFI